MYKDYIKNLILLCLDKEDTFQTKSTIGFTCDCPFVLYDNRILVNKNFDLSELTVAKKHHPQNPYTLWVNSDFIDSKKKLQNDAFSFCFSFPAMMLDLNKLAPGPHTNKISIRRLKSKSEIFSIWAPLVIKEYNPQINNEDLKKYIQDWHTFFSYLSKSSRYKNMHFFCGYFDEKPVSTGLFIVKDDSVYIHWIGTLSEFRSRGFGNAITSTPLYEFKKNGIQKAFLFASVMGKPVYEKLGFTTIGQFEVYKSK